MGGSLRVHSDIMRVAGVERVVGTNGEIPLCLERTDFHPAHQGIGELEPTVLDELRVKAAVGPEIDVSKKHPTLRS